MLSPLQESSSRIVARPLSSPSTAFEGFDSLTVNVSVGSTVVSPVTATVMNFEILPTANDRVPVSAVKSAPALAVPDVTVYPMLIGSRAASRSVTVNDAETENPVPSHTDASPIAAVTCGVTGVEGADCGPSPFAVRAATVKVYDVPFASSPTDTLRAEASATRTTRPPGDTVTS